MKAKVEEMKYKEYLDKVRHLNVKKANLSSYRHVLTAEEKHILITEIQ